MLKPDGVFVSSTACLGDSQNWFRFIAPIGKIVGLIPLVRFFTKEDGVDGSRSRHRGANVVVVINHEQEELSIMNVTTIGLDLAKNVFQVHGIDDTGKVIVRRSV